MSTRSTIAIANEDESLITAIYCHFDGYPEGVGAILSQHYTDPAKIHGLMQLGNLSYIGPELGVQQDFDAKDKDRNQCLAYGRDRGETGQEATQHPSVEEWIVHYLYQSCEYGYLFTNGEWVVFGEVETFILS